MGEGGKLIKPPPPRNYKYVQVGVQSHKKLFSRSESFEISNALMAVRPDSVFLRGMPMGHKFAEICKFFLNIK